MGFVKPTTDEIRDRALRDYRLLITDAVTDDQSDYWATATLISNVAAPMYANGQYFYDQGFPDTADTAGLRIWADAYNVPKLGDAFATGTIQVSSSYALDIPDGTRLTNPSTGATYKTVGITHVDPAASPPGIAGVEALTPGTLSDAQSPTVLNFDSAPPGVDPTATVISISGGDLAWDNARWAKEILKVVRDRPGGGNPAHIISIGNAIPGVEQTFVYPCLRGSGTHDVVLMTSAASGSRVAGTSLLAQMLGALQFGIKAPGGKFISGIPADVLDNTAVSAAVAQPTDIAVGFKASTLNPFQTWPPQGATGPQLSDETSWYKVSASSSTISFSIGSPATGTIVAPSIGKIIGAFFKSKGFCKATIQTVSGVGPWTVTTTAWIASDGSSPTESTIATGTVLCPWNDALTKIAGAPETGSLALSGSVPDFFASLGPGEMTNLTSEDVGRRRRYPGTSDTNPIDGLIEWPTDITSRLGSAIDLGTDCISQTTIVRSGSSTTPTIPSPSFIGTPPSILTLGTIAVIPA